MSTQLLSWKGRGPTTFLNNCMDRVLGRQVIVEHLLAIPRSLTLFLVNATVIRMESPEILVMSFITVPKEGKPCKSQVTWGC